MVSVTSATMALASVTQGRKVTLAQANKATNEKSRKAMNAHQEISEKGLGIIYCATQGSDPSLFSASNL